MSMFDRSNFVKYDFFSRFPITRSEGGYSFDIEYMDGMYDEIALNCPYSGSVGFGRRCVDEVAWFKIVVGDQPLGFLIEFFDDVGLGSCVKYDPDGNLVTGHYCGNSGDIVKQKKGRIVCFSDDVFAITLYEDCRGNIEMVGFDNLISIANNCPKKSAKSVIRQIRLQDGSWRNILAEV